MAEKLIGSLIYGDHPDARKRGAWKKHAKLMGAIGVIFLVVTAIAYKYANYREEVRVQEFLDQLRAGSYEDAFSGWDSSGSYVLADFLEDWGRDGLYTKGAKETRVVNSHGQGSTVIVQIAIDKLDKPVELLVNKETLKLSFAPDIR